ncbi:MAG TPA: hypothetical protein VJB06_01475 [archaeon]|nr:hypothetical protein [archaeon]
MLKEISIDTKIHAFYKSHGIQTDKTFFGKETRVNGSSALFIDRYSVGKSPGKAKYSPYEVDYKSIMIGLYQSGIDKVISVNMCGSLQKEIPPDSLVLIRDFIDFVNRDLTIDDQGLEIADMSAPFDPELSNSIKKSAELEKIQIFDGITYILCVDGSRLETPAEINFLKSVFKKDLVAGMEVPTEAQLAKLLNIKYAALGLVTNYATGLREGPITQTSIEGSFEKAVPTIKKLIFGLIKL